MSFSLFSDSACNLPRRLLQEFQASIVPFSYEIDGRLQPCPLCPDDFDGSQYYHYLRNKGMVRTSLIPAEQFNAAFRPALEAGQDILYIGLSSGISGTVPSAQAAAAHLMEEFPDRKICIFDSLGAGLGIGLLVGRAADCRAAGLSLAETLASLEADRTNLCEYFTVDDLMFLRRGGRVSSVVAALGTMLQLKPLLRGDEAGHISLFNKVRGRKRAVEYLAETYRKKACHPASQRVYISHGDCLGEAEQLAQMVRDIAPPRELFVCMHEPLTGAHVGPGMLALFFLGTGR